MNINHYGGQEVFERVLKTILVTNISLPKSLQPVSLFLDPYWILSSPEFFLICVISMCALKTKMIKAPTESKSYRPNNEYISY